MKTGFYNIVILVFRMPWQGHTDNLIDRFDGRAHLDHIVEYKSSKDGERFVFPFMILSACTITQLNFDILKQGEVV